MKRLLNWQVGLGLALISLSAALYLMHYALFRDAHHIFVYLVGDIAFVPIEVLLVTVIIHRLLTIREKKILLEKMNMVIGAFFSEAGNELIKRLSGFAGDPSKAAEILRISPAWADADFGKARAEIAKLDQQGLDAKLSDVAGLKVFLSGKRDFMLRLLENPTLLEHDSFTDLLWAVFHLSEELGARGDLSALPPADYEHLSGDMARVYGRLLTEWLSYLGHLKKAYPFLYSLAVRTNPLNPEASAVITD